MSFNKILSGILKDAKRPIVVEEGEPLDFDFSDWRANLGERHVFWVATGGEMVAHVKDASGDMKELSREQCVKVWPNPLEGTRRVVVGDTEYDVPRASPKLLRKRKRSAPPRFPSELIALYNVNALPGADSAAQRMQPHSKP